MKLSSLRHLSSSLFVLAALTATACHSAQSAGARSAANGAGSAPIHPVAVSDGEFSRSTHLLLANGAQNPDRLNLLAGVVQRQLARARARFDAGFREAGLDALTGALYLVRVGELRQEMFEHATEPLAAGAAEVARVGNEGQALALYSLLQPVIRSARDRKDIDAHVAALGRWSASTKNSGPMQAAGATERAAVGRSLLQPTPETLAKGRDATVSWVRRALESNLSELPIRSNFDREEAIEAYRALRAGGATLIAMYLRHGDARGALSAIDGSELGKLIPPGLRDRLERAAEQNDPAAWLDLFQLFDSANSTSRPETALDADLAEASAWGSAVALYRSEPTSLRGAGPMAVQLVQYGMAEVAPRVLADALGPEAGAEDLSWALALTLRAIVSEDEIGQLGGARNTFAAAAPLLELADSPKMRGNMRPSAARLDYVMGALETRAGELTRARPLIERAARAEPTIESLSTWGAIDRQRGAHNAALDHFERAIALARKDTDLAAECEARIQIFEIHRDRGNATDAKSALESALKSCLGARAQAKGNGSQARAERLLARVLEQYGDAAALRRATERAYDASLSDAKQLATTVLDAARRALVRSDLSAARDAAQRAVEADLADQDIIYVALWLQLVERSLKVASDGTAEEAYATIEDTSGWPGRLRAWARARLSGTDLTRSAKNRLQRTEATFYTAMADYTAGKKAAALPKLRQVADSESIELVEVTIARDLLARETLGNFAPKLPPNTDLP